MIEKNYGHWHLDYYCDKTDFYTMATGFWNDDEETWDVYFNELEDKKTYELTGSLNIPVDKDFGILVFRANNFDEAHNKFIKWVENVLLPFLKVND